MNSLRTEMMQSRPNNLSRLYRLESGLRALHSNPDAKLKEFYSMRHKSRDCFRNRLKSLLISRFMTESEVSKKGLLRDKPQ